MADTRMLIAGLLIGFVTSQAPIPMRPLGIRYNSSMCEAPVHIDVYIDLECPDSKAAYPNIKSVADHYGRSNVSLKFILFPLPYHGNAFVAAQGAIGAYSNPLTDRTSKKILSADDSALRWISYMFTNQAKWSSYTTKNMNSDQIKALLAGYGKAIGYDEAAFSKYLYSSSYNWDVRVMWKYSCTRGVAGTPFYFVNGVLVNAQPSWTVSQWSTIIDPLLNGERY